jgi:hypothetical protein
VSFVDLEAAQILPSPRGFSMNNVARRWSACVALSLAAVGVSAARNQDVKAVSEQARHVGSLFVSITPNGSVQSHATCTWTANVTGGVAPYHYAWTINNVPAGFDSQFLQYTNNGSAFRVLVTVTDDASAQAWDSNVMSVGGTSCGT